MEMEREQEREMEIRLWRGREIRGVQGSAGEGGEHDGVLQSRRGSRQSSARSRVSQMQLMKWFTAGWLVDGGWRSCNALLQVGSWWLCKQCVARLHPPNICVRTTQS